jgi:hypothetical protein
MNNKVFEEAPQQIKAPRPAGPAGGAMDKFRKAARQLAYDIRYKVKKGFKEGQKTDPASLKRAYVQELGKSSSPGPVKLLAKKMLIGEEYDMFDISENVSSTTSKVLGMVFSEGTGDYVLRVKDPNAGTQYTRSYNNYAAAEAKANQLRKKGLRVEITTSSSQKKDTYDKTGEKKNDGNLANNYPPYDKVTRGDVIAGAKGEDQMGGKRKVNKESFFYEAEKNIDDDEEKLDVMKGKNKIIINPSVLENAAEYFYNQGYTEKDIAVISEGMGYDQFVEFVNDIGSTLLAEATAVQGELLTSTGKARKNPKITKAKGTATPVSKSSSTKETEKPKVTKPSPGQLSIDYNKKPTPPGQERIRKSLQKATSPEAKKQMTKTVTRGVGDTLARAALSAWQGHKAAMKKKGEGGSVAQQIGAGAGRALGSFFRKGTEHLKNSYEFTGWVDSLINEGYDIGDWTISELYDEFITEKSMSVSQQQAAGAAYAAKKGEIDPSELRGASLEMYKTMTKKQLRDFAKTKHEGLPDKKETEDDDNGESVEEQTMGMMSPKERERYLEYLQRKQSQRTLRTPTGRTETPTTIRKGPKKIEVIKSSYEMDEECGCDEEGNEEDPRSMKTKKDLIKNKLRAMGLKMSYEPDGEMIDELNRSEKETGIDTKTGKPIVPGGSMRGDPAFRFVSKMVRSNQGRPAGQNPKVRGKKPPAAGDIGGPKTPAQKVAKRRADAKSAWEFMSDTRGT